MNEDKRCHGGSGCQHCGMDMDVEPYCVQPVVLQRRKEITGRDYPFGLDTNPARQCCKGEFFTARAKDSK
jgi:hypothetical protein